MNALAASTLTVDPNVHDALWAHFVAPMLDGSEGFAQQITVGVGDDPATLFPIGSVVADITMENGRHLMAVTESWSALAVWWKERNVCVWIRAADADRLSKAVAEVRANAPAAEPAPGVVPFDFWQVGSEAYTTTRAIEAPTWPDIADHYPDDVRASLGALMDRTPSLGDGRIVLWYGPPGTGKTTAIRALARAWSGRARFQVVLDPDVVVQRAAILMQLLLAEGDDDDGWRVLVIEDADELLRADAKDRVGQALSRLLNVGDGIVGQGIKVLVLITTNERIERLHPALARPGRCLAQIDFRRFTRAEAARLREDLPPGTDFSLAELMATEVVVDSKPPSIGQYL